MNDENDLKKDEKISVLPKISESFGEILKRLRTKNGLTLEQVSQSTGVNKSTIQRYENGKIINLSQALLIKLSELYQYDLFTILNGGNTNPKGEQEEPIVVELLDMDEATQAQNLQDAKIHHTYLQLYIKQELYRENKRLEEQVQKMIQFAGYLHQDDLEAVLELMQFLKQKNSNYLRFVNELLKHEGVVKVDRVSFCYDEQEPESKKIHCEATWQHLVPVEETQEQ